MSAHLVAAALLLASASANAAPVQTYVEAPGPQGQLKGTMLSPESAGPLAVLIVPGSGPVDRDGNSPLGVKAATYRLLAEALAERGVATVRIDKRGMFASAGAIPDANKVTIEDYAADADAWIEVTRRKTGAPCVWALGHSEGGLVALAAGQDTNGLCGLILVSTAGRPLGAVLREQLRANPANAPLLEQAETAIASLEAGRHIDVAGLHPALQGLFSPRIQDFLIDEMRLDPVRLIAAYHGRVLIIQGDQDLQVQVEDAERLKQARPDARLVVLPKVNHVLKELASDDKRGNIATYADPSLPIAPGVVNAIAEVVSGPK